MEMGGVKVGIGPASGSDLTAIAVRDIVRIEAGKTQTSIVLVKELKRPSEVKAMNRFLKPLCPPAPKKTVRQRRRDARRARHAARPPTRGYWAKRLSKKWVVKVTVTALEQKGDDIVCRPYNPSDYRAMGAEDKRSMLRLVRQRSGGGLPLLDPSSLSNDIASPTETS